MDGGWNPSSDRRWAADREVPPPDPVDKASNGARRRRVVDWAMSALSTSSLEALLAGPSHHARGLGGHQRASRPAGRHHLLPVICDEVNGVVIMGWR